jgi:hypothetical protein
MRENKHTALVIKSFLPGSSRVILFDKYDGKCNAFTSKKFIPHGSLIHYRIRRMYRDVRSITCEVELMPIYESEKSQLLFHHMLELCHYFVPFEYQDEVLFDFLYEICVHYRDTKGVITETDTKLILFKLCILLGIYPRHSGEYSNIRLDIFLYYTTSQGRRI